MRILLIEGEKGIVNFLKPGLEAEPFVVDVAENGERGSYLARTNDYDAIILANILTKKTGIEVCREIRSAGKNMPILVLSIKSDTATKIELLNGGADDYLVKPFSLEELRARIRALLRRPKEIVSEILTLDDLVVDTRRCLIRRGRRDVHLTRKEFMLLECLMKNKGLVLSRGMIMEHVWDMSVDPFSNTIESHILSLRKKIDFPGKRKLIRTVSGRGYKIEAL